MLENIIDALIQRIKDVVVTDKKMTDIPLAYLMTLKIPDSVKHFFDQEVELWIREEEEKFSTNERFDYDTPDVRMLIDKIFDHLKQNSRFHITKFNQLLERAVKLEMNYLIEPQRTLTQFIFKDNSIVSTIEVYDTLKYFFKYEYYKNAISDYFNTKYLREISQDQFAELIAKIDKNAFSENCFETTLQTVKAISDFIGEALEENVQVLSLDTLLHAFKDRKLDTYSKLFEELKTKGIIEISLADLENVLRSESIENFGESVEEEKPKEETQLVLEEIKDIEESKPKVEVEDIELSEMRVEPEEVEEEEEEEEEYEEEEELEEVERAKPEADVKASGAKVADELADFVAGKIKSDEPLENIDELIAGRVRKKIIKKLFKKNESDLQKFIGVLNDQNSWKSASILIDEEFYQRGINPYSKEALQFSDIVYTRFFPKDKYVGEDEYENKF